MKIELGKDREWLWMNQIIGLFQIKSELKARPLYFFMNREWEQ